jgi:PAS domain S-box-containing protein
LTTKSGEIRWVEDQRKVIRDASGSITHIQGIVLDITKRRQAETALRESEERFQQLLGSVQDVVWAASADGREILYLNLAVEEMYGWPQSEFYKNANLRLEVVHPDDQAMARASARQLLEQGHAELECRIIRSNGEVRWIRDRKSVVRDASGQIVRMGGITSDITLRKNAESQGKWYQGQLQSMATELSLAEERQRRQLATDLHDGVSQFLAVIKMRLSLLHGVNSPASSAEQLAKIEELVNRAEQSARSLTSQLSPPALYDLGLAAAVEWLAQDIQSVYGLKVTLHNDGSAKPIGERVRVILFQCLREVLVNVAKHAKADEAQVCIGTHGQCVQVTVEDHGIGFDPAMICQQSQRAGFGLFSIRERIQNLSGRVAIHSAPGKGTSVMLEVPASCGQAEGVVTSP